MSDTPNRPNKYRSGERRRDVLGTLAVAAGSAALAGTLPGCVEGVDGPLPSGTGGSGGTGGTGGSPGPDAATPDAAHPDAATPDAATPDAATPDAATPDAAQPDAAAGEPDLVPLRGDGSHPFDYIDTLVIVQMENRSFDHFFGSLTLEEGRDDVEGLRPGMSNPDRDGHPVSPAPLRDVFAVEPDPSHGHRATMEQWNGGACDGFVRDFQQKLDEEGSGDQTRKGWIMGYYTRRELPASYGLADAFTLADHWFCGMRGPTWPNRYFSHCASSGGLTANNGFCSEPTPYTALAEAGFTYRVYYTSLFFTLTLTSVREKNNVKMDRFFADCEAGTLANVNIVEPSFFQNDDHPPADVRNGQAFIATVYEALRRSPQWNRCLMVLFYDEHGGFHDHVDPPESLGESRPDEAFARLGFRIPGLIIGPLVKRGHVMKTVVDHSSVPALISEVFGLPHVNERSRQAGRFDDALDVNLARGANRPPAPMLAPVIVPERALDLALYANLHQPELEHWFRKMGMAHHASLPERRRLIRNYLLTAKRLGTVKFT